MTKLAEGNPTGKTPSANEVRASVRKFRKELGISQSELASLAGLAQHTLSRFEKGKRNLSPDALNRLHTAIAQALQQKQAAVLAAENDIERWVEQVDHGRAKYPDFDEKVNSLHMAVFGRSLPPKGDPAALDAWKKTRVKDVLGMRAELARQWGAYENYQEMVRAQRQIVAQERRVAALQAEIAAQAEQIAALRDLLDIKTKEALLRDKIESEEPVKKSES